MIKIDTLLLQIGDPVRDREAVEQAGRLLREGGTVILPTETVYGLGANALDPIAVGGIFAAKGRPQDNPLIVHLASLADVPAVVRDGVLPPAALLLAERFWPGPLTMILPKAGAIPRETSGGLETVAVRVPGHPVARAIIAAAGVPIAAPSANRSGSPSPTTAAHCVADMWGRVDAIVESGPCGVGVESTVVSLTGAIPRLLRPGAVTLEQLREVLGRVEVDGGVTGPVAPDATVSSPGMKYKHYAPRAEVILLKGGTAAYAGYLARNGEAGDCAVCFDQDLPGLTLPAFCYGGREDHAAQAAAIFSVLRQLDDAGMRRAYVHCPDTAGVGLAVYNRLIRAAAFHIIALEEG